MTKKITILLLFLIICAFGVSHSLHVWAAEHDDVFRSTPYPLPRFLSINVDKVYVRTGPGKGFPVKWVFKKKGIPVEVILEYDVWRKIKDHDGDIGWIHKALLSGKRMGIIHSDSLVSMYRKPKSDSRIIAYAEPESLGRVESCKELWCKFISSGYKGWVKKNLIWGVYEDELFD
ncbi:MAG: SH3 domain-containing protein [Alphaproteobacteria bacterium]|nr:SH3 domain-containing protein [Alphaproteobacteria bacterium]